MAVAVQGLVAMEGETAFAFFVIRTREPISRTAVLDLLRYLAPLIPDPDTFLEELAEDLEQDVQLLALPWLPPEAGHAVDGQRRLIESAGAHGVEAAWFFQTGTSLPLEAEEDPEDEDEEGEDDEDVRSARAMTTDDSWAGESTWSIETGWSSGEVSGDTKTTPIEIIDMSTRDDDLDDDDDPHDERSEDDDTWSHGPPPQVTATRFPVDGYPEILDELDWEDFGVAVKLRGSMLPGEGTLLFGFHTLWLAPYGGRHRNAAVTVDRRHHAAHFWVDRFAVPCPVEQQVQHLLWILSKLDQVVPIVHARFGGATMAQKYAGLVGEPDEPFVLGGNPLLAVHAEAGEPGVDRWIAEQTEWSSEEVAQMLRELAIEVVTARDEDDEADEDDDEEDDDDDGEYDEDDEDGDDEDDGESEGSEDEDRGRHVTLYAGELLVARAMAGTLDARVAPRLLPLLAESDPDEHRRRAAVQILGALRYRPAVPALIRILDETTIASGPDGLGRDELIAATATALGAVGDPAAIDALARVITAPGRHNDRPRPVAADALASCLAAAPEPRHVDDRILASLLATVGERNDAWHTAESQLAYGRIAHQLPPERRAVARRRLVEADTARDDAIAMLARQAALVLASPTARSEPPPRGLGPLLHDRLTSLDYDHEYTVRNVRIALRVAAIVPELVDPDDLVWLTRFAEADVREAAHALLVRLGKPLAPAAVFDPRSARELEDEGLVRAIGEPHVVGRAALIGEAGRRGLARARRAIVDACHDVVSRARPGGENLLDPDVRVLEAAVPILREPPLDDEVIVLFDRMLRHPNYHVKWELLQAPPRDERLLGGMFHVLGEKWGWQQKTARAWLAAFEGTAAYETERERARRGTDDGMGSEDPLADDEDMN